MKKRFLEDAPLFATLTDDERITLASQLSVRRFHKGAVVFEENEPADAFYLVKSGMVRLVDREGGNRLLANLGPGSFFGEIDMLLGQAHGSTAIAGSDLDVWVLTRTKWERLASSNPTIAVKLSSFLGEPVADVSSYLVDELRDTELLSAVSPEALEALSDRMRLRTIQRGELLYQAGAEPTAMYFIEDGEIVVVSIEADHPEPFRQLSAGEFFGQTALLAGRAYGAVARAATEAQVWQLDREDFEQLIQSYSDLRQAFARRVHDRRPASVDRIAAREMLRQVPIFANAPDDVIEVATGRLRLEHIEPDDFIFHAGDAGDALFLIDRGYVSLVRDGEELDERGEGEHFGQQALLTGRTRTYSAKATTPVILWYLTKTDFEVLSARFPALAGQMRQLLRTSLAAADEEELDVSALRSFPLFSSLDDDELEDVAQHLTERDAVANEYIFTTGEPSRAFFLLREGEVKLARPNGDVKIVRPSGFFGEIGLLTNSRRKDSAQAISDVSLYEIDADAFESVLMAHPEVSVTLNRALSARLEAVEEGADGSAVPASTQTARTAAPAIPREVVEEEGLLSALFLWFAARSRGAKIRMALVAILFFWLVGVTAPTMALGAMLNGNGNGNATSSGDGAGALSGVLALVATPTPTDTPTPVPTTTPEPTNTTEPTDTPEPTNTPEPTDTPVPTDTPEPTSTATAEPTETPVPPTDTPVPPTNTPLPQEDEVALAEAETESAPPPTQAPPPPTNTPEPAPAAPSEPARNLDPRLGALGVSVEPANVPSGQPYWRVTEIIWHDEDQAEGRHSIFVNVLDENNERLVGQPVTVRWGGGSETLPTEPKPFPEYGMNFPMYAAGQSYSVWVEGLPSDRVHGMGLGDLDQRDWNIHVEYLITYQKVVKP